MIAHIVAVHGTFASGPKKGDRWWQVGSEFASEACESLTTQITEITHVKWHPFQWDGKNSEASRRAASKRLAIELMELDAADQPVFVIGHSHGGSIVEMALLTLAKQRKSLPNLKIWMTVGAPFLQFSQTPWAYARSGLLGRLSWTVGFLTYYILLLHLFDVVAGVRSD